jgi:hypothetical protein
VPEPHPKRKLETVVSPKKLPRQETPYAGRAEALPSTSRASQSGSSLVARLQELREDVALLEELRDELAENDTSEFHRRAINVMKPHVVAVFDAALLRSAQEPQLSQEQQASVQKVKQVTAGLEREVAAKHGRVLSACKTVDECWVRAIASSLRDNTHRQKLKEVLKVLDHRTGGGVKRLIVGGRRRVCDVLADMRQTHPAINELLSVHNLRDYFVDKDLIVNR